MTILVTWRRVLLALIGLVLAALLFAWSGIFNIAASSGHWPITDWALHWAMRNSVKTHAFLDSPPDPRETDGALVSAAGHFAAACALCHGAPGVKPSPVMQQATPPAPDLSVNARHWTDGQLFYILRHGVKYTGMPAWGAKGRDDEVRRLVTFVRRLPGMSVEEYRALSGTAAGAASVGVKGIEGQVLAGCVACHGADGRGRGQPDVPVLGGQTPAALAAALHAYRDGRRASAVMGNAAAAIDPEAIPALARHFAAMPGIGGAWPGGQGVAVRIVARGLPEKQLPACAGCHRPGGRAPVIAGQRASYLAMRLRNWQAGDETIDARRPQDAMAVIARRIPEEMVEPISAYLGEAGR